MISSSLWHTEQEQLADSWGTHCGPTYVCLIYLGYSTMNWVQKKYHPTLVCLRIIRFICLLPVLLVLFFLAIPMYRNMSVRVQQRGEELQESMDVPYERDMRGQAGAEWTSQFELRCLQSCNRIYSMCMSRSRRLACMSSISRVNVMRFTIVISLT